MTRAEPRDWTDAQCLNILDLAGGGHSQSRIGEMYDVSKNVIAGLIWRIARDTDNSDRLQGYGPAAARADNCDGGMPARWWVEGLRRQGRRHRT